MHAIAEENAFLCAIASLESVRLRLSDICNRPILTKVISLLTITLLAG